MKSPNFICFIPDQFRFDLLGCAKHPCVQTPNIDKLASEGVRFDRCYTIQPMCMTTRSTWFTGRTPRGHGVRCNGIPLNPQIPTITETLRRSGYRTHSIGKLHLNPWMPHRDYDIGKLNPNEWPEAIPLWKDGRIKNFPSPYYGIETADALIGKTCGDYYNWLMAREPKAMDSMYEKSEGFSSVEQTPDICWKNCLPAELHQTSWAAECAEKFLDSVSDSGRPFFLWVSIPDPHPPYTVADPYFSMYSPDDMPLPSARREGELEKLPPHYKKLFEGDLFTAGRIKCTNIGDRQLRKVIATVCGLVTQWDGMLGRIMKKLSACGLAGNTVTVFMSDHGQMLGDHWMLNMPPTHLDGSARVPCVWHCPSEFQKGAINESLISHLDFAPTVLDLADMPFPEGTVPPAPEAEQQLPACPGKSFAPLLKGEKKKIQDSVIIENDADYLGMRQRTVVTSRYHLTAYIGESYGELFDLRNDPRQLNNLWHNPDWKETKTELLILLMERFAQTDGTLPRRLGHA